MNNPVFVWINDIKLSASLPTANCEFISSKRTFNAITSTAIARNCYISNGPALMELSNDYQDNIVVCAIQSISTRCTKSQYHQLVNFVHDHNENLVGRFLRLIGLVTMAEFKPFIDFILDNERVLRLFMNSEASFKHHHSTQGGLFEHSIEVAEMTYQNAKHLGHSDVECQTGLVAALFHDIGKIYPALQMNSDKYHAGTHERYAFALLAKPLGELGTINSRVFSMLCELLAAKPYGHKTRYPIEHVLKQADRTSAESNLRACKIAI